MNPPRSPAFWWLSALALGLVTLPALAQPAPEALEFFEKRIRPVLIEHCYECHSAESKKLKGGLLLDTRAGVLQGGDTRPALEPGEVDKSLLIEAVRYSNPDLQMPPQGKLPEAVIADLEAWVKQGAIDPREGRAPATLLQSTAPASAHWAFQPLQDPVPPAVKATPTVPRTPVDRFILAKLEEKGLHLSPPAHRRALLRRAALTLTGLPPTPEDFVSLEQNPSPGALTQAVDRLLASPHYGERWARHWLDVARFAESSGFEHDYDRPNAWPYRDYVIRAFNTDQPYDEFVRWQLAGDEFAPEDPFALMATGFLGAGVFPTQITANEVERARYDALDDMASTAGAAFLGLTVGCARCHDHKFDPIATRDYYRLISTFSTTVRSQMDLDLVPEENARKLRDWEQQHAEIVSGRARFEREQLAQRFTAWLTSTAAEPATFPRPSWLILDFVEAVSAGGATLTPQLDGSLLASGKNPDFDQYTFVTRTSLRHLTALRVEALADPSFPKSGPGRADNGNFALSDLKLTQRPVGSTQPATPVKLLRPRTTFEQKGLPVAAAVDEDPKSGWAVDPEFGKNHAAVFELAEPIGTDDDVELTLTLKFDTNNRHSIGRPRLSVTTRPIIPEFLADSAPLKRVAEALAAASTPGPQRTPAQLEALRTWHRQVDPEWGQITAQVAASLSAKPKPTLTPVMVATEGLPALRMHTQGADFFEQTFFLKRGDPNLKGDAVNPGFLPVLMRQPETHWQQTRPDGVRTSYRRRALANWMTDPQDGAGQLLARVVVNRVWSLHFGRGLVATPNDFGRQGELPTHPELLNWLAREFMRSDWSVKALQRLILNSAVWQQESKSGLSRSEIPRVPAASPLPLPSSLDPENKLLWHFPRHRLEAEAIRDNLLAVSGALEDRLGGPGTLDEQHLRRSVYFMVKRSQLSRTLQLFDAPDAVLSVGNRPATITAPQALLFLNSPFVRARARDFAQRLLPAARRSTVDAVRLGYELSLGRPPTPAETSDSTAFLTQQLDTYRREDPNHAQALALEDFCQVLFGLNEFVYVE